MIRINIESTAYKIDRLLYKYMRYIFVKDGIYSMYKRSPLFIGDLYYSRGGSIYRSETLYKGRGNIITRDGDIVIYEHHIDTELRTTPTLSIVGASIIKSIIDLYRVKTFKGDITILFEDYLQISSNLSLVAVGTNAVHVRDAIEYALLSFTPRMDTVTARYLKTAISSVGV